MKALKLWLRAHGLCPCCWIVKLRIKALSRAEKCAICACMATLLSVFNASLACAEEEARETREQTQERCVEVQLPISPPCILFRIFRIPSPRDKIITMLNANEERQYNLNGGTKYVFR